MTAVEQARALHAECTNQLWMEQAKWVIENLSQDVIYQTNVALYEDLKKVNNDDSPEADAIRDECEVFWYALDDEHRERLEEHLAREP